MFAKFDRPEPIECIERKTMKNTANIVMGNAKEKRFNVGAERVITPIDTFINRRTTANGSIMIVAALNIKPAADIPAEIISCEFGVLPIGRNS